jgi:hypothetical protein
MRKAAPTRPAGLICRGCGGHDSTVVYTRKRHGCVVRSRKCKTCRRRMLTKERPVGEE